MNDVAKQWAEDFSTRWIASVIEFLPKRRKPGRPRMIFESDKQRREYVKLRAIVGAKAAREEMFRGISDEALLTNPRHVNNAWEKLIRDGKRNTEE